MRLSEAKRMIEDRNRALERHRVALEITINALKAIGETRHGKAIEAILEESRKEYRTLVREGVS